MDKDLGKRLREFKITQKIIERSWRRDGNKALLDFFVLILPKVVDAERCSIFVHDPSQKEGWIQCGTDMTERVVTLPEKGCLISEVVSSGKHRLESDMTRLAGFQKELDQWNPTPTRNMLCVPILSLSNKKVTGVIQVVNKVHGDGFTEEDIALMEKTAYHLELAIENLFLSRDMVRISDKMQEKVSYADFML
ncbi:GAF domain-containing protein, partial [Magnetococcales bacterium HHB-1]